MPRSQSVVRLWRWATRSISPASSNGVMRAGRTRGSVIRTGMVSGPAGGLRSDDGLASGHQSPPVSPGCHGREP